MGNKLSDLLIYLNEWAPFDLQEKYDNSGLLCGNVDSEIKGVLCSLDCTEEVVIEAMDRGCNVVVSHHPIIFQGLKSVTGKNFIERALIKAIKNDINIISYHTNLDSIHPGGINSRLAQILGLKNCQILGNKKEIQHKIFGMGLLGDLPESMNWSSFFVELKEKLDLKVFKYTRPIGEEVIKVAVCGGSGSFLLQDAIRSGAEVFITSDYKYHQFFEANDEISVIDIGHYESERHSSELIHDIITDKFANFAVLLSKVYTNPIKYHI